ncbi:aftiphilin a [Anguilla anguilla]|uniref:aftiphilin a n=1 Tax=Anguilla anguilla TaxID=7936 RepID=UPI0015B0ADC4|nr:aftiphilin a [Anguilla anguilla]
MEPDVIRMYSSSPPPLDDGAEDDDDDFGDFGAFSGVPSSVSFTEFDTPPVFGPAQTATAADTSPPSPFAELGPGPAGRGPSGGFPAFPASDPQGADSSAGLEGRPAVKTVSAEELKRPADHAPRGAHSNSSEPEPGGGRTKADAHSCNGGFAVDEVLTNGFVAFDGEDAPSCPSPDHPANKGTAPSTPDSSPPNTEDEFDDFSAFGGAGAPRDAGSEQVAGGGRADEGKRLADGVGDERSDPGEAESVAEENGVRDSHSPRPDAADVPAVVTETLSNGDRGSLSDEETERRDADSFSERTPDPADVSEQSGAPVIQNGNGRVEEGEGREEEGEELGGCDGEAGSTGYDDGVSSRGGKGAENEVGVSVSESFASFCQAVSPDGTEDFGDFSVPGLAPSACPEEETLTPADPSWPTEEEEEEEDFGDFGDASSVSGPGFADFDRTESEQPAESADSARDSGEDEGDFGDFSAPQEDGAGEGTVGGEGFAEFPGSDSFADFSAAPAGAGPHSGPASGWSAFEDQDAGADDDSSSWAAFGEEQSAAPSEGQARLQDSAPVTAPPADGSQTCRRDSLSVSLACRLERLFHTSFPDTPTPEHGTEVLTLRVLLDPPSRPEEDEEEAEEGGEAGKDTPAPHEDLGRVWRQLLEIHDALGLRYQWGGSHSNKALLCSLGIDTRNILFTGQKKQPVIVPMYAASLGMLEPTKEPVKPISAAEKIASIAQAPPPPLPSPEMSEMSSPDPGQEALPPVQFDWSSSGLTNPLDASGGSCLLNLDFFGPVDDSSSSSATSIPGVDPELYELTTAKMDTGNTGSRIADAFARLMSTVEKTSTSTRKPKKEENLSEEAAKVIAGLPDLSFMQAKVLMFPTTLTPLGCSAPSPD